MSAHYPDPPRNPDREGAEPRPALNLEAVVAPDLAQIEIWQGRRCVLCAEIDDELPYEKRRAIAEELRRRINEGWQP